ncbi:hypothetical protein C4559_03275 [Candidatus Microgenomates bacterium]|nr:MAG: hypothetical protein C4559_03275 [Candidatus Microgenomates bacterium]
MKKFLPLLFLFITIIFFFKPFLLEQKLPIPADTIIGLYHPFRDLYAKNYPNGIPFKNFLITDPVRQQYPWKKLGMSAVKSLEMPIWNPYSFAGTPLLANYQSAIFYPLNILFIFLSFDFAWSLLIILQLILAGIFLYLFLINLRLAKSASLFGSLAFIFSGFSIAWLEWGTIMNTALWLPLILLSVDKIFTYLNTFNSKLKLKDKKLFIWLLVFLFSLVSSFFAGHLQIFFYSFLFITIYFFARWLQNGKQIKSLFIFLVLNVLFLIFTAVQWVPTLQFISLSARDLNSLSWQNPGWFIPWKHLIQFIIPDFFGNPTTLNYWGIWNYGELTGYIGILPLLFAFFALFFRKEKKVLFFGSALFLSLLFSLPTFLAKIPFILKIPFISTSQPTRLLFIIDFSLAVLAAFGFDYLLKNQQLKKKLLYLVAIFSLVFSLAWFYVLFGKSFNSLISIINLNVTKQNLIFPTVIFILSAFLLSIFIFLIRKDKRSNILVCAVILITIFDLLRFGTKFTSFTNKEYLFPNTTLINFLTSNIDNYRIMSTDSRILPPNFSNVYKIQSIEGYDPLYLKTYANLISTSGGNDSSSQLGFGFDRIITPQNFESKIIDLLGVKYVLSLSDLPLNKLEKVFQEGQTRVYENKNVIPRVFFVENLKNVTSNTEAIKIISKKDFDPLGTAIIEGLPEEWKQKKGTLGKVKVINYSENKIVIETENEGDGFLVLTDSFYPNWHAKLYSKGESYETEIFKTDYNFRGVFVPKGKYRIEFYIKLFPEIFN